MTEHTPDESRRQEPRDEDQDAAQSAAGSPTPSAQDAPASEQPSSSNPADSGEAERVSGAGTPGSSEATGAVAGSGQPGYQGPPAGSSETTDPGREQQGAPQPGQPPQSQPQQGGHPQAGQEQQDFGQPGSTQPGSTQPGSGGWYDGGYPRYYPQQPHPYQQQYAQGPQQPVQGHRSYPVPGSEAWQQQGYAPMPPISQPPNEPPAQQPRPRRRAGMVTTIGVVALVAALIGGGAGSYAMYQFVGNEGPSGPTALNQPPPARSASNAPDGSVQKVADKVLPSVVQLQLDSVRGSGEGSGIVLSEDGYILTNNHVAEDGKMGRITAKFNDHRTAPVKVVGNDPNSDLAVVKADIKGLQPAELGRSDDLPVGAPLVAIGSPFGLSGTVTSGILSAKDRPVRAGGEDGAQASVLNALQTDAAINPGNSGGPLVDMDGRVVGINSAIYSPQGGQEQAGSVGLGFSIPIDQAKRTARELIETGTASQTTLGVTVMPAEGAGAQAVKVEPGGAAKEAGLHRGDIVTKIDDRFVEDPDTLVASVRAHEPGDTVQLTVQNGGDERTVEATLTDGR